MRAPLFVALLMVSVWPADVGAVDFWSDLKGASPKDQAALLQLIDQEATKAEKARRAKELVPLIASPSAEVRKLSLRVLFSVDDKALFNGHESALRKAIDDRGEAGAFASILWARTQPAPKDAVYTLLRRGSRAVLSRDDWVERGVVDALSVLDTRGAHPLFDVILRTPSLKGLFHRLLAQAITLQGEDARSLLPALREAAIDAGSSTRDLELAMQSVAPPTSDERLTTCLKKDDLRFRALDKCVEIVANTTPSPETSAFFLKNALKDQYIKDRLWTGLERHATTADHEKALAHLKRRLRDPKDTWRESVAKGLLLMGSPGREALIDEVKVDVEPRILVALEALRHADLAVSDWKPICWRMFRHPSPRVRAAAARAMKRPGKAQDHIRNALRQEKDGAVRVALWMALSDSDIELDLMKFRLRQLRSKVKRFDPQVAQELKHLARRAKTLGPAAAPVASDLGRFVGAEQDVVGALVAIGEPGWRVLGREVLDDRPAHRLAVLKGLRWTRSVPKGWAPLLEAASQDENAAVREGAFQVMAGLPPSSDVLWHLQLGLGDSNRDVKVAALGTFLKRAPVAEGLALALSSDGARIGYRAKKDVEKILSAVDDKTLKRFVEQIDARVAKRASGPWLSALHRASPKRAQRRTVDILQSSRDAGSLRAACELVGGHREWATAAVRKDLVRLLRHRKKRVAQDAARALLKVGDRNERQLAAPIAARKLSPFAEMESL